MDNWIIWAMLACSNTQILLLSHYWYLRCLQYFRIQHLGQKVEWHLGPTLTGDPQYATGLCTRKAGLLQRWRKWGTTWHIPNDATAFSTSYIPWDKQNIGTETNMKGCWVEMLQWCRHQIISAGYDQYLYQCQNITWVSTFFTRKSHKLSLQTIFKWMEKSGDK